MLTALPRSSPAELTISALSLALLVPIKELNVRFRDRLPTPIPGEIVLVRLAPGSPPPAQLRLCPLGRSWLLPPPRGMQRAHRREAVLKRVLCQAPSQNTLTLRNPHPHVTLHRRAPSRPLKSVFLRTALTAPPLPSLLPGSPTVTCHLSSFPRPHFSLSNEKSFPRLHRYSLYS